MAHKEGVKNRKMIVRSRRVIDPRIPETRLLTYGRLFFFLVMMAFDHIYEFGSRNVLETQSSCRYV